ncbi:hypothetical protein EZV62_019060 [Acer yangbiense]|uniref:Cytochrome P450 n=1 Tax=Acer yangbiense TaxID=1000413 RepID=A0A5C7HA43_9ROSI|nr:hypothetical protein EZV62_019060 [Acer yangbiense]
MDKWIHPSPLNGFDAIFSTQVSFIGAGLASSLVIYGIEDTAMFTHREVVLLEMLTRLKKAFVVWYGTTPRVAIMEPKLIKEILLNKFGDFPNTEINSFTKLFATGLASYDGHKWTKHRKIINPAFHFDKLKQMLPAFSTCTQELIEKLDKLVNQQEGCCELDVSVEFLNLTGDVISRAAFGSNFEEGRFMPTKVNKRMRQIYGEVRGLLRGITEKREKSIHTGNDEKDDLLSLLLKSNMKELQKNQDSNAGMTQKMSLKNASCFTLLVRRQQLICLLGV